MRKILLLLLVLVLTLAVGWYFGVDLAGLFRSSPPPPVKGWEGVASWYGPGFNGKTTANGEIFNMNAKTAAHRTLPFNTLVRVVNLENGKQTVVRINDRGPYVRGRIIDLSKKAAEEVGIVQTGLARVRLAVVEQAPSKRSGN